MAPILDWNDLAPDHGVLELHETLAVTGAPIKLYVFADGETGGMAAWWEDSGGDWFWLAKVGEA